MTIAPDPAEITPPHSSGAYSRRRGLGLWAVLGLCLLSLAAGAALAAYGPHWWPIRETEGAFAPLTPTPRPLTTATTPPAATPVEDTETATVTGDVSGLESRVQALETGQERTIEAAAAALASALLAEAAATSRPFEKELAALEQVLPLSPDALALRRLAETGAPTRSALAAEFDDAAARASVAARDPGERGAFFDRVSQALARIVTIRRVGSTVGAHPDAVLARAERQVDEGDIDGALTTLNALPPSGLRAMGVWRAAAERRAEIDRHVVALRATALANLAQVSRARP
jgi:hypothetical protein